MGIYLIYMMSFRIRLLIKQDCSIEQFDKNEIEKEENVEAIAIFAGNIIIPIMAFILPFLYKKALGSLNSDRPSDQPMGMILFVFGMLYFFMQTTCSILYFVKDK